MTSCPRVAAYLLLKPVIYEHQSLADLLRENFPSSNIGFTKELCFGVVRWHEQLRWLIRKLLSSPKQKLEPEIELILLIGLYQIRFCHLPSHAAVNSTVSMCTGLKKAWAKAFVNAILRNYLRQQEKLISEMAKLPHILYSHPQWLVKELQQSYPQQWLNILEANQQQAPLSIRINHRKITRDAYLKQLNEKHIEALPGALSDQALILKQACSVEELPGFREGWCSVQDEAPQLAATLLELTNNLKILDACAAPGGKTGHILEKAHVDLLALDKDPARCKKIFENLNRLQLSANIKCGDASHPENWWDKQQLFDRILLDAPCSATGVIRRQPDIKLHRSVQDIKAISSEQEKLLKQLWPLLKPGGLLLYATCSVLPIENSLQIEKFLKNHPDAELISLSLFKEKNAIMGLQILPGESGMDGFYYAKLKKLAA